MNRKRESVGETDIDQASKEFYTVGSPTWLSLTRILEFCISK